MKRKEICGGKSRGWITSCEGKESKEEYEQLKRQSEEANQPAYEFHE